MVMDMEQFKLTIVSKVLLKPVIKKPLVSESWNNLEKCRQHCRPFPSSQYHHKPQSHVSHTKGSAHLEWKPKSLCPSSTNREVSVSSSGAPSPGDQAEVSVLSKKLSQVNVSGNEQVIIPEHIWVPDSERTHLIFGTFESEVSRTSGTTSDTGVTKEGLIDHSPSSLTALNAIISTDVPPSDKMEHVISPSPLPESNSITSVSEHQQSSSEAVEVSSPHVVGEFVTEVISSKVAHSQPQFHHQDNSVVPNIKTYEPDSRYGIPFIAKAIDGETAESIAYPSEAMGLQPANANQLPAVTQHPVPQMYPQQFQLAANGMKYGLSHQYKQVFPGTPAGYGGYVNHNGYTVNTGVIGSMGHVEDVNMSKYKENNLYTPNLQAETADLWVQGHREVPNMPSAPFYNGMYPGFPHTLQPTSMAMVQNPQAMAHQAAVPQLAGNLGLEMATMAPGSQDTELVNPDF
ncbi:hypothetical protein QOZ80_3BG0276120 [Eleusine coracana subsp. coracana]|nr:hypothetical protein QOZ80_3BG0276120 [Eleusine coracana subsp. coracana]